MRQAILGLWVSTPLLLGCSLTGASRAAQAPDSCRLSWSSLRRVTVDEHPVYVETKATVRAGSGLALFGVPTMKWQSPKDFLLEGSIKMDYAGLLLSADSTGSLMPFPPGVSTMREPRAIGDDGVAHVFWGAGVTPADTLPGWSRSTGIKYARFDGVQWSTPEQLLQGATIIWLRKASAVLADGGEVDIVAKGWTTIDGEAKLGLVTIRKGRTTTVRWDNLGTFVNYVALARGRSGLLTFFVATLPASLPAMSGEQTHGIYLKRGGATTVATPPALIYALGPDKQSHWPEVIRVRDTLHLFWVERPRGGFQDARIMHATSADDAMSWTFHEPLLQPEGTDMLEVAVMGQSILVLLRDGDRKLQLVEWRSNAWGIKHAPFAEVSVSMPVFVRAARDSIQLTWGIPAVGVVPALPLYRAPRQVIATIYRTCSARN